MSNISPIVITGYGIVSAIGVGKENTLTALRNGISGIRAMCFLDTIHREFPVGEVQMSNEQMKHMLGYPDNVFIPRTSLLGQIALLEALIEARLGKKDIEEVQFISGTTVGGMDRREATHLFEKNCDKQQALIATFNCADCTEMIANPFGKFASLSTISTACSSATNAIIAGADKLRVGLANIVVVGGAECLTKFHLNGFNTLMILDHEPCKPFDRDRQGLNLGEGAAYLVMETLESAKARHVEPITFLTGYGNACDAFHQTASSSNGEGAYLAMTKALKMAGIDSTDIDYINAHGTGTPNNDVSESNAIRRVFGESYPPVSSTKSFTGHTTSASGSIEAAICILAMQNHFIPANLNWHKSMEDGIQPVSETVFNIPLNHVLSNAFGFGGNDSCLIFSEKSGVINYG